MYTDQAMNEGGAGYFHRVLLIPLVFFLFVATCTFARLSYGRSLKQVLSKPVYLKVFIPKPSQWQHC